MRAGGHMVMPPGPMARVADTGAERRERASAAPPMRGGRTPTVVAGFFDVRQGDAMWMNTIVDNVNGAVVRGAVVVIAAMCAAGPAAAQTGEERSAYRAVAAASAAFESASGAAQMLEAAQQVLAAAKSARRAFAAADRRRDSAAERYSAASNQLAQVMMNCETRDCTYESGEHLITCYTGIYADYGRNYDARVEIYTAIAAYLEVLGISGAGEMRGYAADSRRFANRMRGIVGCSRDSTSAAKRIIRQANSTRRSRGDDAERAAERATAAHVAANRAVLAMARVAAQTIAAAGERLTTWEYAGTGADAAARAREALHRARGNALEPGVEDDSGRTDTALDGVMTAARLTMDALRGHLQRVDRAVSDLEGRYAGDGGGGADVRAGGGAGPAPEPAGEPASPRDWIRDVSSVLAEVERAVAEAEQSAIGDGSWTVRLNQCSNARDRQVRALLRMQNLTFGGGRPPFVPLDAGLQAWNEIQGRADEAQERVQAICSAISDDRPW